MQPADREIAYQEGVTREDGGGISAVRYWPEWLSPRLAALYTGLSTSTLQRHGDAGTIEVVWTPGGHRRYFRASLDRWLEGRRRE